jgi:hypothetical protein
MVTMRLPKPLYEIVPALYSAAGFLALLASYELRSHPSSAAVALGGIAGVLTGLVLWLRRRDYRAMQDRYRGELP